MKKIILILCILLLVTTHCFANILQQENQTISFNDDKLDDFLFGITFKKYDNQYYIQSKLLHTLNKQGYVITLEDCKLSSDTQTIYLPVRTSEVYCGLRQKLSIKLNRESVSLIQNTNQLTITLPYYKDGSDYDVRYQQIDIPISILSEWKQVINM